MKSLPRGRKIEALLFLRAGSCVSVKMGCMNTTTHQHEPHITIYLILLFLVAGQSTIKALVRDIIIIAEQEIKRRMIGPLHPAHNLQGGHAATGVKLPL